jgi:RNA recognition motif-containing protein
MKIYVSNLGFSVTDADLSTLFAEYGNVVSAKVIMDRETGRSRGFAFVEMSSDEDGKKAIQGLNNKDIQERTISVSVAKDKSQLGGGGGFRSGGSGGFGGGGGNRGGSGGSSFNKRY